MTPVDLRDFFLTSRFGPIHLGMTRAEVMRLAGAPENWGGPRARSEATATVWRYGTTELYFESGDDLLTMIFTDYVDPLDGGAAFAISPWIVRPGLTLEEAERLLVAQSVPYRKEHAAQLAQWYLVSPTGVRFTFYQDERTSAFVIGVAHCRAA